LLKIVKRVKPGLKTNKYHIISSWILLTCFVAGQYMVFSHQHNNTKSVIQTYNISKNITLPTVKEKCYLCDVMNHNTMVVAAQVYLDPVTVAGHVFENVKYSFTSIQLILSGGRAPPLSIINDKNKS
jgi:hypothetical protein